MARPIVPPPRPRIPVTVRDRGVVRPFSAAAARDTRPLPSKRTADGRTMANRRMVLEIGMGTDIRGADPTKAACRAVRDALWNNSLSIAPALGKPLEAMIVDVRVG